MSDPSSYLPAIINNLQDYVPDLPDLPEINGQTVVKQVLGIGKFFNPNNPNFPVTVCTVFILLLGSTVIILRIIWRRIRPAQLHTQVEDNNKKTEDKTLGGQRSNARDDKQVAPTPASRWKRQTAQEKTSVLQSLSQEQKGDKQKQKWKRPIMTTPPEKPERHQLEKKRAAPKPESPKVEKKAESEQSASSSSPSLTSRITKGFNILKNLSPKTDRKSETTKEASPKASPKLAAKQEATPKSSPKLLDKIFGRSSSGSPALSHKSSKSEASSSSPAATNVPKIEVTNPPVSNGHTEKSDDVKETFEENSKILSNLKRMWGSPAPPPAPQESEEKQTEKKSPKMAARQIHLNIDKDARNSDDMKKNREEEINLVRTMGREFRELAKLDNPEAREERRQEMEKVKSARSYFKTVEKIQQNFERDNSANRFNIENENLEGTGLSVGDLNIVKRRSNFFQSIERNSPKLSQFEPGKLNKNFTSVFEGTDRSSEERGRAPKKKIISPEQVLKTEGNWEEEKRRRQLELEEMREARKNWVPPEDSPMQAHPSTSRPEVSVGKGSVTKRWLQVQDDRKEKTQSLEIPGRVSVSPIFMGTGDETDNKTNEVEKESRRREPTGNKVTDRWIQHCKKDSPKRSRSAQSYHRNKLPDNAWVQEKSEPDDTQRRKALMELEVIKKAREEMDDDKIYDFTTKRMEDRRREALMELETVKSLRKNRVEENIFDEKVDPKALRQQEIDAMMKMRSSGKEYAVESVPGTRTNLERSKSSHTVKFRETADKADKEVKAEKKKATVASKASTVEGEETTEQKHLAACLMDRLKEKTDLSDVLQRSESFFKGKLRSLSSERKEQKEVVDTAQKSESSFMEKIRSLSSERKEKKVADDDEEERPKTPSMKENLKLMSKSMEKFLEKVGGTSEVETEPKTPDSTLMGRIRGRSMERKADIYAKIKETRDMVQNTEKAIAEKIETTEKAIVEKFETTEKVFAEKIDMIRSKSQETKKRIMSEMDLEALTTARTEIVKTEVGKNMYKVSTLERDKEQKVERKTSKSNSSEKVQNKLEKEEKSQKGKKVEKSSSSEIKSKDEKKSKKIDCTEKKEKVTKSKSGDKIEEKAAESEPVKTVMSSMMNKYTKAFMGGEEKTAKAEVTRNIEKEKEKNIEDMYSKVSKKPKNLDNEKKSSDFSHVPDLIQESVKVPTTSQPVKSYLKKGEDGNKINFDDLQGYKIEKCDLKARDPTKILPSRVVNCTPRPFMPFAGESMINSSSPAFQSPSESPMPTSVPMSFTPVSFTSSQMAPSPVSFPNLQPSVPAPVSPSPIAFSSSPNTTAQKPTPKLTSPKRENKAEESTTVDTKESATTSPFTKFVDSIQFPSMFEKTTTSAEDPPAFVATVGSSTSQTNTATTVEKEKTASKAEKFAKYIQKKTEKETKPSESTSSSKPLTMGELSNILSADHPTSILQKQSSSQVSNKETVEAGNILTADLPDVANVKEKADDKFDENAILSRFKEFKTKTMTEVSKVKELKTKTISEVSKLTRSRSVQKKETTTRRGSTNSDSKVTRTTSENRAQKAGKFMKDFTTSILKRR